MSSTEPLTIETLPPNDELKQRVISQKKQLSHTHLNGTAEPSKKNTPCNKESTEKGKTSKKTISESNELPTEKDAAENTDSSVKAKSNIEENVTKQTTNCSNQESGRKFQSICRKCQKHKYNTKAVVLCFDCGISLCKSHADKSCEYKSHKLVSLRQCTHHEPKQAPSATHSTLRSVCYHCKKRRSRSEATAHCYDCGKTYCSNCAEKHSKNSNTFWHDLWILKELFGILQQKQVKSTPSNLLPVPSETQALVVQEPCKKKSVSFTDESTISPVPDTTTPSSENIVSNSKTSLKLETNIFEAQNCENLPSL